MTTDNRPLLTYRVRVGHHEFQIKARDVTEAIFLARRQLSRELPRLIAEADRSGDAEQLASLKEELIDINRRLKNRESSI